MAAGIETVFVIVEVVAAGRACERDARFVVEVADGVAALLVAEDAAALLVAEDVADVLDDDDELGVDVALLVCDEEEELETIGASAALLELLPHAASDEAATRTDAAATVREVLRLVS